MLGLPRPCRYSDLSALAAAGGVTEIAILVDVSHDAVADALRQWREVLPDATIHLFAAGSNQAQAEAFIRNDSNAHLANVLGEDLVCNNAGISCRVWATCASYDASGVYVKTGIESSLIKVLRKQQGVYLAHDTRNGIIRELDSTGLRDRILFRRWRKAAYRSIWRIIEALARIASRLAGDPVKEEKEDRT